MLVYDQGYGYGDTVEVDTPGQILAKAQLVDSAIEGMQDDISTSPPADANTLSSWTAFYTAWKAFYNSLAGISGWLSRLWGGTMAQVEQYETQANSWRSILQSAGVAVTVPAIPKDSNLSLNTLIYGAVALGGLLVVGKLLDFLPKRK